MQKKVLSIPLADEELVELYQLLVDRDAEGALAFLQTHARHKVRELLDSSKKVKVNRGQGEAEEA